MSAEQPMTFQCMAAMMDILGTSNILCSRNTSNINKYIRNLEWIYDKASDVFDVNICTSSDNILAHTDDCSSKELSVLITSLAELQYDITCHSHLLVRGGVTKGGLYHNRNDSKYNFITGDVVVSAHNIESKISVYPRIVLDDQLLDEYKGSIDDRYLIRDGQITYIDYLNVTYTEEFYDEDMIETHRFALIEHIKQNNKINIDNERWLKILSKDTWVLSYHNNFCKKNNLDHFIDFDVVYNDDIRKDIIQIKEMGD